MIGARVAIRLVCLILFAGCASSHAYTVKRADAVVPCQMSVPERDLLFGVALSGGGSRAALFGAAGLEALAHVRTADGASVIESIAHLSSVSGGSIAAAYYVLKKPGRDVKVLGADETLSDAYRTFFEQYRAAVSQNFETSLSGASSCPSGGSTPLSPPGLSPRYSRNASSTTPACRTSACERRPATVRASS